MKASDGLEIKELTKHMVDRMVEREVSTEEMKRALLNPLGITKVKYDPKNRPSINYVGYDSTVFVNSVMGRVVSVRKTGKRGLLNTKDNGYITGVSMVSTFGKDSLSFREVQITPLGIEYLFSNSMMEKVKNTLKDIKGIIPVI